MEKVIEKISSYNLFNYLLPGVIFVIFSKNFLPMNLVQENVILDVFLYYFIGLVISRFGSLVIEPVLKKIKFLIFAKYEDLVSTSKIDSKIEIFLEENNIYRTFVAMFSLLLLSKLYLYIQTIYQYLQNFDSYILIALLFVMFSYSYRKQTAYITKRINRTKN
ncbi:MAG: hypothetical protein WC059_03870 [Candidatus Paceibacterota bacterium]